MRIVLMGATGFVGKHLLPELSRRGYECRVLCRQPGRYRELRLISGVELRAVNKLGVESLAAALAGADVCINLVGILNERGRKGAGFQQVHVEIVKSLIQACRQTGVRRVIQMSALNAGNGDSYYLRSKGQAEDLLRQSAFVDVTILQPSVIFGAGDSFFNRFAALLRLTPVLPLACPGSRLQPVWVGDVVAAVAAVLQQPATIGATLELAGPKTYTLKELVSWTARSLRKRRWIIGLPDALSRIQGFLMDFVPGKPFSTDNYRSLQVDNVSRKNALRELGINPVSIQSAVPVYLNGSPRQKRLDLWRSRSGGSPADLQ